MLIQNIFCGISCMLFFSLSESTLSPGEIDEREKMLGLYSEVIIFKLHFDC